MAAHPGLERAKEAGGWTWRWLARQAGYSEDMVHAVRQGRRRASERFRQAVAAVLGADEGSLFCPEH